MLRRLRELNDSSVQAVDGQDVGTIEDSYFDDERWTVRYLVVRAGHWLTGRSVLLSPMAVEQVSWDDRRVRVDLTQEQIKGAPSADDAHPITREWEAQYAGYYGLPHYWDGPGAWGVGPTPLAGRALVTSVRPAPVRAAADQRLKSARDVTAYHIHARDGVIGHVDDFLIDDVTWKVRYLIVDTSNWIGGRTVLVSPDWASRVDWTRQEVYVDLTRAAIKACPPYEETRLINRAFEDRLDEAYRRGASTRG
jgi:sporulation protein YlmC with PRC-barrel domain